MPVHIKNVNADLRTRGGAPAPAAPGGAASGGGGAADGGLGMSDRDLTERLRPIVMEIMRRELDELRRRRGAEA